MTRRAHSRKGYRPKFTFARPVAKRDDTPERRAELAQIAAAVSAGKARKGPAMRRRR